jgi:hypothetical protein
MTLLTYLFVRAVEPERIGAQALNLRGQFGGRPRELPAHSRRQIDHLNTATFQTDLFQQLLRVFNSPAGVEITFQVMAVAFQSTRHQHAVGAILKSAQHIEHVDLAGAR